MLFSLTSVQLHIELVTLFQAEIIFKMSNENTGVKNTLISDLQKPNTCTTEYGIRCTFIDV